jgi:hypothetical protein
MLRHGRDISRPYSENPCFIHNLFIHAFAVGYSDFLIAFTKAFVLYLTMEFFGNAESSANVARIQISLLNGRLIGGECF